MTSSTDAVRLSDIRFGWGTEDVISIGEFVVPRGQRVLIEGPSGCGKSTLLGLIGGVTVPRGGTVTILGERVSELSPRGRDRFRADHIGVIFQLFNLVPYLSMLENVCLPCRFSSRRRGRVSEGVSDIQAEAFRLLNALGLGAQELLERPVTELSIGQQQRVAAARALMGRPEILIADEPTSALDEAARGQFLELVMKECDASETTLLLVSHDARLAPLFERHVSFGDINRSARSAGA